MLNTTGFGFPQVLERVCECVRECECVGRVCVWAVYVCVCVRQGAATHVKLSGSHSGQHVDCFCLTLEVGSPPSNTPLDILVECRSTGHSNPALSPHRQPLRPVHLQFEGIGINFQQGPAAFRGEDDHSGGTAHPGGWLSARAAFVGHVGAACRSLGIGASSSQGGQRSMLPCGLPALNSMWLFAPRPPWVCAPLHIAHAQVAKYTGAQSDPRYRELVAECHAQYTAALEALFQANKEAYAPSRRSDLRVVA